MKILASASTLPALSNIIVTLARLLPDAEIFSALTASDTLNLIHSHDFSTVLLDGSMDIADRIREASPSAHIITSPSPLLLSPETIRRQLKPERKRLYVQTFGGFSVFCDGKPLVFRRTKAKELFAVLVDRRGCSLSSREACAIIFEDRNYDGLQGSYFRVLVSELKRTLKTVGFEGIIWKSRNSISVDINGFDCDAYRFLEGDPDAVSRYNGDYMICYSWAEYSSGMFDRKKSQYC